MLCGAAGFTLLAFGGLKAAAPQGRAEVRVLAAASLTDALQEIVATYERTNPDRIVLSFGASSMLARQIERGAPADIFVSADENKVDVLAKQNLVARRVSVLSNTLVIVMPNGRKYPGLFHLRRIAIAEPRSVPAGIYWREFLEREQLWDDVRPHVIPTENVRAALAAVDAGNAEAAFVYETDARIARRSRIVKRMKDGPDISYPFVLLRRAENAAAAQRFFAHLQSNAARAIFAKHGFIVRSADGSSAVTPAARRPTSPSAAGRAAGRPAGGRRSP
jgi:molybdate transport system substrate-binding protein